MGMSSDSTVNSGSKKSIREFEQLRRPVLECVSREGFIGYHTVYIGRDMQREMSAAALHTRFRA